MTYYTASVSYPIYGGTCVYEHIDFTNAKSATSWVIDIVSDIMRHWSDIDDTGLEITAAVESSDGEFCDIYKIKCGC